ncbi:MAG: hypothetical protein ACXWP5_15355 [Bdellovibrionota bacterium]
MAYRRKHALRKNLLIYPKFQLRLILANFVILALTMIFVGVQAARSFSALHEMGIQAGLKPEDSYFRLLSFQSVNLYSYLGVAFVAGIALSSLLTLVLSHRLAGPIVRLRAYFTTIAGPESKMVFPLQFRKGDFFSELPPVINHALGQLTRKTDESIEDAKKRAA